MSDWQEQDSKNTYELALKLERVKAMRKEVIGNCTMYLGDCRDVLPTLGKVDAVVTDPPYGIDAGNGIGRADRIRIGNNKKSWDERPADINVLLALDVPTVIWGGNYFGLPASRGFLIWDKNNSGRDFADCEMAWTNQDSNARLMTLRPMNMDGGKVHPTQKPIVIMEWCITYLPEDCETILDPYCGSASTGVACVKLGRKFIGIELDPDYFEIACDRIRKAYAQPDLFIEPPAPRAVQDEFDI